MRRAFWLVLGFAAWSMSAEVPAQDVRVVEEDIVLDCGSPCIDRPPMDRYDRPRCSEYEFHDALSEAAGRGDASSIELLLDRYATAETLTERNRLGGMLLGKIDDDSAIWNELVSLAEIVERFPDDASPVFQEWCAAHAIADPDGYWTLALNALDVISTDRRSRPLLLRALATDDFTLRFFAIDGLGRQHALDTLPLIESAIDQLPEEQRSSAALDLVLFRDERADALARKYFEDEADAERYREVAQSLAAETAPR
jgi:hypothetical protein